MPRHSALLARLSLPAGLLLTSVLLGGCLSSRPPAALEGRTEAQWRPSDVTARLDSATAQWEGTPHKWGSASPSGVDCSGLVQAVFADAFRLSVPRSTEQQARVGRVVSRSELRPGDLVFFRTAPKTRHVGIYLSDGDFLHASSSEGVTVSPLDRSYWTDHWWHARRLLRFSDAESPPESAPDSTRSSPTAGKIGW